LPEGTLEALLEDPTGELANILLYHVVGSKAMSNDLSDGQTITTLQGSDITVSITGGNVFINEAQVITADIETDNGVVHVIDAVITPSTGIEEMIISSASVSVYPNPASELINIRFELTEESEISLEMYDMLGQQVRIVNQGYAYEGSHTLQFPVNDLESGMYLLIINTGNSQIANKVRVVK
jgi:transforming growth factor-beta-induced protein